MANLRNRSIFLLLFFLSIIFPAVHAYELKTEADGTQWKIFEKYGYLGVENGKGKIIIPAQYSYVNYEKGTFTVKDNSGHIGKYTKNGKVIFPPIKYVRLYEIKDMKNSPFIVIGEHWGVVDRNGKVLLEDVYTNIRPYGNDKVGYHYMLWKDGFMGVSDMKGKILIEPNKYNSVAKNIGEDGKITFIYSIYGGGSGVCNDKGEEIIHTNYYTTLPKGKGKEAYYEISDGNGIGKLSLTGEILTPLTGKKDAMIKQVVSDGKSYSIWRDKNNKCYVKNPDGKNIIDPIYDWIDFYNNHFTVWKGQFMGLINNKGEIIVSTGDHYISIGALNKYIIATTLEDKQALWGYDGKLIFPAIHKNACLFEKKIYNETDSIVSYRDAIGCWGVKDLKGNVLVQPIYDELGFLESDLGFYFYVFKNGKVGLQDLNGNLIFEPEYNNITISTDKNNPFFFINTGYMGVADMNGNIIINPEIFDKISFNPKNKQFTGTVGKRRCVFSNMGKLLTDNKKQVQKEEYTDLADAAFEKGNYKKAAELYGKAISVSPSASLYFNRGVSYYNANKYYEAIADFNKTLNCNPSDRLRNRSLDLIGKAEHYQKQKEYNQMQLASAIFGLAMTGVNYALQSKSRKSSGASAGSRSRSSSSSSSSSSYSNNQSYDTPSKTKQKQKCGFCAGKGSTIEHVANYGIDKEPWCDECGKKVVSGHYHKTCTHCHGTGER